MRHASTFALGTLAAAWCACFNSAAPAAPCADYQNCPADQQCDALTGLCLPSTAPPAVISSFTATPTRVPCGTSAALTAVFSGGSGAVDQDGGTVQSGVSIPVSPPATTSPTRYTLTVTNAAGRPVTAQLWLSSSDVFSIGPALSPSASEGATATRLRCGKVLLAGGSNNTTAVLFDAAKAGDAAVSAGGALAAGRMNHTATLLRDGRVLIAGGSADRTAELFGPGLATFRDAPTSWDRCSGTFSFTGGRMVAPRWSATATLLPDGRVLIAGGGDSSGAGALSSAELFDPAADDFAGAFSATGPMATARTGATATLLDDGRVLIAGGVGADGRPLGSAELYDPAANSGSGGFLPAASLLAARRGATATLLPSGNVLVAGGSGPSVGGIPTTLASAELYRPVAGGAGAFTAVASALSTARSGAAATLLGNGQVLIVGGFEAEGFPIPFGELFDAGGDGGAGTFRQTCAPLYTPVPRAGPTATLLPDGTVLIAGGQLWGFSGDLFVPSGLGGPGDLGTFVDSGASGVRPRAKATATLLRNGDVLVVGGVGGISRPGSPETATLFHPAGRSSALSFSEVNMLGAHLGATATLLRDGRVLIAGGYDGQAYLNSAELYTPAEDGPGSFSATGPLQTERRDAAAVLLPDGRVAVFGGSFGAGVLATAELFDPAGNGGVGSFTQVPSSLLEPRTLATATLLPSGEVLLAGGRGSSNAPLPSAELFDPAGNSGNGGFRWPTAPPQRMVLARVGATAVLLPNGKVLLAGGYGLDEAATAHAELYDVSSERFLPADSLHDARAQAIATQLPNGEVLIAGGVAGLSSDYPGNPDYPVLTTAELYYPFAATFSRAGDMQLARANATATLLLDGRVLIADGDGQALDRVGLGGAELYSLE